MLLISFCGWRVSKSIPVSRSPHAAGDVPCLQLNCGFLPFSWCGKWDPVLENSGSSSIELSDKDAGFAAEPLESLKVCFHL